MHSAGRERTKLSQPLFKLLSDTKLHQVCRGPRGYADQQAALYKAARGISLGGDLMLSGVLYTVLSGLWMGRSVSGAGR